MGVFIKRFKIIKLLNKVIIDGRVGYNLLIDGEKKCVEQSEALECVRLAVKTNAIVVEFYEFRVKLEHKCRQTGIELRVVNRFYPSSKLCHNCGHIKSDLKLSDRIYKCECGYEADRDYNASLNLRDAKIYRTA